MYRLLITFALWNMLLNAVKCQDCNIQCPTTGDQICSFNPVGSIYKVFPNICEMNAYTSCYRVDLLQLPMQYCQKNLIRNVRRMYGESCPMFCPNHYRPICGASKLRDYIYRSFNNGCYLDMINCRGGEEYSGYVEVPLQFCQNHAMKNIFKQQVVVSNFHDY